MAAILHDASLEDERELIDAVGAAASITLENERLDAELRAKIEELSEQRRRGVVAALEERRRLERNLHDGAQQRLVSMALKLRLARGRLDDPERADRMLADAAAELDSALEELRELARGIHPAVLSDRGLVRRWNRWPGARRSRWRWRPLRASGCPNPWSWPPTSWWPRR